MSEQILKEILSKLNAIEEKVNKIDDIEKELKELKEGQNSLKKDVKDLSGMVKVIGSNIDSEIVGINKKLDRLSAKQDIFSATVKEHELRLEDLEISPPIK